VKKLNAIRCLQCLDVIQSRSTHDFVRCSCGSVFVDGGQDYQRVGGRLELIDILMSATDCPQPKVELFENVGGI